MKKIISFFIVIFFLTMPKTAYSGELSSKLEMVIPGVENADLRLAWSLEIELNKEKSLNDFNQRYIEKQAVHIASKNAKILILERKNKKYLIGGFIGGFVVTSLAISFAIWGLNTVK